MTPENKIAYGNWQLRGLDVSKQYRAALALAPNDRTPSEQLMVDRRADGQKNGGDTVGGRVSDACSAVAVGALTLPLQTLPLNLCIQHTLQLELNQNGAEYS